MRCIKFIVLIILWAMAPMTFAAPVEVLTDTTTGTVEYDEATGEKYPIVKFRGASIVPIPLMSGVTSASSGTAKAVPSGFKSVWIEVGGTGAVLAVGRIFGHNSTDVSKRVPLATFSLSGTTYVPDIVGSITTNPPYMSIVLDTITGTGATFSAEVDQ